MIYNNILEVVGNVPIIHIARLLPQSDARVYLKLEGFNPTGSIKDRTALNIINCAEKEGTLQEGYTIIESTSGNFGKSLAMIGAARGYPVVVVVDPKTSKSTLNFYKALGTRVEMVNNPDENGNYQTSRVNRVQELLKEIPNSYWTNQYENRHNPEAHAKTTAKEILTDFEKLDVLVASISTGGHITGIAATLRHQFPSLEVVAVDAVGSSIFGFPYKPYLMNGIGLGWFPSNLQTDYINRLQLVSDLEAFSTSHLLAKKEGILVGGSGGAVMFACLRVIQERPDVQNILGIIPDHGANYLDEVFDEEWLRKNHLELADDIVQLTDKVKDATPSIPIIQLKFSK